MNTRILSYSLYVAIAISIGMLFLAVTVAIVLPPIQAEAVSEDLAPHLPVDKDDLRRLLTQSLMNNAGKQGVFWAIPFLPITLCLLICLGALRHAEASAKRGKEGG